MTPQKGDTMKLSPEATALRAENMRQWRRDHPDKARATGLRYWEKKARIYYGDDYQAPTTPDVLSPQAVEMRRRYYATYRKNNPDIIERTTTNYWERKVKKK